MMTSNVVDRKQECVQFRVPRRIAKLEKPPPLRKATVMRDVNIASVPSREGDTVESKDNSSTNENLSSVTKISSTLEVEAKGNEVSQETLTRNVQLCVNAKKLTVSRGLKLEKPPPLKTSVNNENKDAVKKTIRLPASCSPASMAMKLIYFAKQERRAESEDLGETLDMQGVIGCPTKTGDFPKDLPVSKNDITKPESHGNQESFQPRYQSQMSADSGFGDNNISPSLSRQSSNLSSVGEDEFHGREKEAQDLCNMDKVSEPLVFGPKQFQFTTSAVNQPQSFNSLTHVSDTADHPNHNAKTNASHQGQRNKANNFTQLCSAVNYTQISKQPINSIVRWETEVNGSSKTTNPDKYSGFSTTNSRNGNQYTEANSHSKLHNSANYTSTEVSKAVYGNDNWESDFKSISQPNNSVTYSQLGENISQNENWETDLIDINNNGFSSNIKYSTPEKPIPDASWKKAFRIPAAGMDWENEIYDSGGSSEQEIEDETICHMQEVSSNMNEKVRCLETGPKRETTDLFICVSDQSTTKANSVINMYCEKDSEALEKETINNLFVYNDSYRSAENSYDTASSLSMSTEADGVLSCSTDEPLNETEYAWELIEDLSDRMENISIHSPPERSPSLANHSTQSRAGSLEIQNKSENVKTCMLPSCDKNSYLPDDQEYVWELIDKTSIVQHEGFNKSNSSGNKEASFSVMKNNSQMVVVHIREPISPSSSADFVQRVEEVMSGISFSAKWRRKMFTSYRRTLDVEDSLDNDVTILQYSIEQLVEYAKSPSSRAIPSEWSYLTKVFPEVCLSEVLDLFDPEKFLANYSKVNTMDRFRYYCENTRNSQPRQYNTQERGDNFSMDHRNKESSVTQPIRSGFGVPRQNSHKGFTADVNKERSVTPPIRYGFGVPRQNSNEEFTADIETYKGPKEGTFNMEQPSRDTI